MRIILPPSVSLSAMVVSVLLLVLLASPSRAGELEDVQRRKLLDVEYVTTQIGEQLWAGDQKNCFHMFGSWPAAAYMYENYETSLWFNDIDVSVIDCLDGSVGDSRLAVRDTKQAYFEDFGEISVDFHWTNNPENPATWADINAVSAGIEVCPPALPTSSPEISWILNEPFMDFAETMTLRINDSVMARAEPSHVVSLFKKANELDLAYEVPAEATFRTAMTGKFLSPLYMSEFLNIPSAMRDWTQGFLDTYEITTWAAKQADTWYQFTDKGVSPTNIPLEATAKLADWSLAERSQQLGRLALTQSSGTPCMAISNLYSEEIVFADTISKEAELTTSCCIPMKATPMTWQWPAAMLDIRRNAAVYRDPLCLPRSQHFLSDMPFGPIPCHCGSFSPQTEEEIPWVVGDWQVTDGEYQFEQIASCEIPPDVRTTSSSSKGAKAAKSAKGAKATKKK